jgi:hypothetical protein
VKKSSQAQLKILYSDIIRGYSFQRDPQFGNVYIKHLNLLDSADIDIKAEEFRERAHKLPTNEEQEEYLIKEGLWSKEKNIEVKDLRQFVDGLVTTKSRLHIQSQVEEINKQIIENKTKLSLLEFEKSNLIGLTQDNFTLRKSNEFYMYKALFKDAELTIPCFSAEDFDELDVIDVSNLSILYNNLSNKFSALNLKRIAVSPFFLNIFYLCEDNAFSFFGRAVSELTFYQFELFNHGKYFKYIISESKGKIDDNLFDDPDSLIDWFNSSQNAQKLLEKAVQREGESGAVSLVGATKEDYKRLGIQVEDQPMVDFATEAKKHGGTLTMAQMLEMEKNH